jgi:sulfane dehydrogenase subunit SoxC
MGSNRSGRRQFLKSAALAGLGAGAARVASGQSEGSQGQPRDTHSHGQPSPLAAPAGRAVTRSITHTTYYTPVGESVGIITPASLHFMQAHSRLPDIDPAKYSLTIHGMVDRPLMLSLQDLKRLPSVSRIRFLECLGNSSPRRHVSSGKPGATPVTVQFTHGIMSCSEWAGVPMSVLLKEVGVKKEASWLVAEGSDGSKYTYAIPLTKANDDVLVAYMQNGEPLRPENGFPARMFVPGFGANHSVKWLRRIMVVDRPYMTWDQSVHHSVPRADLDNKSRWYNFVWPPKSVITRPSAGQQLPGPGYYEITGLAWSGWGTVRKVEVSVDGGKTWKEAKIQDPVLPKAHTRFNFDWTWNGEETVIQSRCTDDQGEVQPTFAELNRNWGRSENDRLEPSNQTFHWNAIQPWKIARDGSITDALFA